MRLSTRLAATSGCLWPLVMLGTHSGSFVWKLCLFLHPSLENGWMDKSEPQAGPVEQCGTSWWRQSYSLSSWWSTCSGKHAAVLQAVDQTQKHAHKDCQHFVSVFVNSVIGFTDNDRKIKVYEVKDCLGLPAQQKKMKQRRAAESQDGRRRPGAAC